MRTKLRPVARERGLADTRRTDQAEDRALHLAHALLHREVLQNSLLDLLQPKVVRVEHFLGALDVLLDPGALLPGDAEHPVEIVAHDRGLGGHGAHVAQLLELGQRPLARFLAELGLVDLLFQLAEFVSAALTFAQLLLDRLELLAQMVLALGPLHLAFDPFANALFHLKHADLALHQGVNLLQPGAHGLALEQLLLLAYFQREVRAHGVGQLAGVVDLVDRDQDLWRDLLVQLDVLLELGDHRARQGIELALVAQILLGRLGIGLQEFLIFRVLDDLRPLAALDQHLDRAIRQLEQLQYGPHGPDRVDVARGRVVLGDVLLGDQQNLFVVLHDVFEGAHGLLAADEERHDHMRKDHNIAEREHREQIATRGFRHRSS
jgi:hypothetical protein